MARLAREYFDRMPNKDVVAWNAMITYVDEGLAAEARLVDEAAQVEVVCRMPACKQDAAVLGALLGAHRLRGDVTMANCIGKRLVELEPASSGAC
ncbi:unnamed protein product [Malus baccata var. baccata]